MRRLRKVHLLAGAIVGASWFLVIPTVANAQTETYRVAQYDNSNSEEAFEQRTAPAITEGYREMYGDREEREAEQRRQQADQARWMPYAIFIGLGILGAIFKGNR